MAKILMVEDDEKVSNTVREWLTADDHVVETVPDGKEGADRLRFYKYDIVILDINLPEMGGLEILRNFRAQGGKTPVLILTGHDRIPEKAEGLDAGADDYLTKPFHMQELSARVRALLRRPAEAVSTVVKCADLEVDLNKGTVLKNGKELRLFRMEYSLLEFFLKHQNQIFSAEDLLDSIWSSCSDVSTESVRTYIARLRAKIDTKGQPSLIENVYGRGWRFLPPVS